MMRVVLLLTMILILYALPCAGQSETATSRICKIYAASLYYLPKFTSWPDTVPAEVRGTLPFCVVGSHPLNDCIAATLEGRTSHGKDFEVRRLPLTADLLACAVVFVGKLPGADYASIAQKLDNQPVLTVSLISEYPSMVHLGKRNNKLSITVDLRALKSAGLSMSSELLSVSTVVGRNG